MDQGIHEDIPQGNKIGASTPSDFSAHNLTSYGGLLPLATMLEKLGFLQLVEETLTIQRQTRSMPVFRLIRGMVLACYVGFSRLHHLRFLKREPMLTVILQVVELPPQSTLWRFLAARIWRHPGRVAVSDNDHYQNQHVLQRVMERLRRIPHRADGFAPVLSTPLRA
ncbi:MAG: hypothetical protein ACP5FH_10200 [Terracidiphilus sp.]